MAMWIVYRQCSKHRPGSLPAPLDTSWGVVIAHHKTLQRIHFARRTNFDVVAGAGPGYIAYSFDVLFGHILATLAGATEYSVGTSTNTYHPKTPRAVPFCAPRHFH